MMSMNSALAPCFMVYPMPSIADESLLQVIFHHKVSRSIFAGYGLRRLAIVELNDAVLIAKVCAALEKKAEEKRLAAQTAGEVTASALGLDDGAKTSRKSRRRESAVLVEDWLDTLVAGTSAVTAADSTTTAAAAGGVDGDQLTIADLFAAAPITGTETAPKATAKATAKGVQFDVTDAQSIEYITALHWRGHPLHVIVSPVSVEEFHLCGGTVPVHAAPRKSARGEEDGGVDGDEAPPRKSKRQDSATGGAFPKNCCQKCGSSDHFTRKCDGSGPGPGSAMPESSESLVDATPQVAKPAAAAAFPKNCCQKCGSPDHFTRKCDGSGPGPGSATPQSSESPIHVKPATTYLAPVAAVAAFPKDCCQKCGSPDHFTRKCDGSGPASGSAVQVPTESPVEVTQTIAKPAIHGAPTAAAVFPKDCCQKCGSPDHFTRKCDGGSVPVDVHPTRIASTPAVQPPVAVSVHTAAAPAAVVAQRLSPPAPVPSRAPAVVRTSKDQCKVCGSSDHLSRHCPNK